MSDAPATVNDPRVTGEAEPLPCPMCDYDLRGQVEPRCPECGYRFDWEELRDPARRLHPYLFEHHPESNVRSFFRTLFNGFRPQRFWSGILPAQRSRPRRLILYFAIISVIALIPGIAQFATSTAWYVSALRAERAKVAMIFKPPPGMTTQQMLDKYLPMKPWFILHHAMRREEILVSVLAVVPALLWPWITFAALLIFRISMSRARVRPIHMLRCVLYSADILAPAAIVLGGFLCGNLITQLNSTTRIDTLWVYQYVAPALAAVVFLFLMARMNAALRDYLRFDHPKSTLLATQIIVLLVGLNIAQIIVFWFDP